jgi:hypothetical protein
MSTLTRLRPRAPSDHERNWLVVVAAVVASALLGASSQIESRPPVVERLVVANPTEYAVVVSVSGADDASRLTLGQVQPATRHSFLEVLDHGDDWFFHFAYAGVNAGGLRVSSDQLEAGGSEVSVPPDVAAALRAARLPPTFTETMMENKLVRRL